LRVCDQLCAVVACAVVRVSCRVVRVVFFYPVNLWKRDSSGLAQLWLAGAQISW
jgi:hypothetical protein